MQGEPGAVVLALLLLARLDVCPVDLALLNGAHVVLTEPLRGLVSPSLVKGDVNTQTPT